MKSRLLALFLALFMVFAYVGCSKNSGGSSIPSASTVTTGVTGTVTDMQGNPLSAVTIYSEGNTSLTNKDGLYSIKTSASKSVSVTAEFDGYARNTKIISVTQDTLSKQDIKLAKVDTVTTFNTANGSTLKAKEATVLLPVGTYTLDDGTTYTGDIVAKATYNKVTTINGNEAYPGEFIGETTDGDTKVLQSYGFIDVTLQSDSGENVNLASGALATLTYPKDSNIKETPETIPLWYFDTQKGIWIEEGVATYDATTNSYVGTVGHFSTWNLDSKFDGAVLKGCVEDANGIPMPQADIYLSTAGWNKHVLNNDISGDFEFINAPSNITVSIVAKLDNLRSAEQTATLLPNQTTNLKNCLVIDANASDLFVTLQGKLVNGDGDAITGQAVSISSVKSDGTTVYIGNPYTDNKGVFSLSIKQSDLGTLDINSWYNNIQFDNKFPISNTTQKIVDLGTIKYALSTISACVTLQKGSVTSENGVTTLPDGTILNDGTTITANGYTTFGTNEREFSVNSAYNVNSYNPKDFGANGGYFTFTIPKDNLTHDLYAHTFTKTTETKDTQYGKITTTTKNYNLTGKLSFLANASTIDLSKNCLELSKITALNLTANTSLSSSNSNVHLEVSFLQDNGQWGEVVAGEGSTAKSLSFDINNNGKYIIKEVVNDYNQNTTFDGTVSLTVNGQTYTITLPSNSSTGGQPSEWWTAFSIESYNGSITVTKVNKAW